ncbi:hypothetical protein LINPERPRIM_LOCUS13965 [Linum perenne]
MSRVRTHGRSCWEGTVTRRRLWWRERTEGWTL